MAVFVIARCVCVALGVCVLCCVVMLRVLIPFSSCYGMKRNSHAFLRKKNLAQK
jgi:hypothetical protein